MSEPKILSDDELLAAYKIDQKIPTCGCSPYSVSGCSFNKYRHAVPALIARLRTAEERIETLRGRIEGEYRACSCKDNVGASMSDVCAASSPHVDCVICEERLAVLRADAALASRPHDAK